MFVNMTEQLDRLKTRQLDRVRNFELSQGVINYLYLTIGSLTLVAAFNLFMGPHNVAPGGLTGITLALSQFLPVPRGFILLGLQLLMILFGMRYLGGKSFAAGALYSSLFYSLGIELLAGFFPAGGVTDDPLLNTIYGGLLGGVGVGLIFRGKASLAGTSVISRVLQLRTGIPISQLFLMVDGLIIFTQGMILGWDRALYALIMLFLWGLAVDYVLEGPSVVRTIFVVTAQPDSVSQRLHHDLGVGVTAWSSTGTHSQHTYTTLFCTVKRGEMNQVKTAVKEADPQAFWVVGQGHQARGY